MLIINSQIETHVLSPFSKKNKNYFNTKQLVMEVTPYHSLKQLLFSTKAPCFEQTKI